MSEQDWIWNKYWHSDRIASCFDGAGGENYSELIAGAWRDFFRSLPAGSKILDLCTGNGAIAIIAAEVSRAQGLSFEVHGADRAEIDPSRHVTRQRDELAAITFHGSTAAEDLPFDDAGFDATVSQYGLEYTDTAASAAELLRVLRPGGRLRVMVHAQEGIVSQGAAAVVDTADRLLDDVGLFAAAERAFRSVDAAERDGSPAAETLAEADAAFASFELALNRAVDLIDGAEDKEMIRNPAAVLADAFRKRSHFDLAKLLAKVDEVRSEVVAHRERSRALVKAALSEAGVGSLRDQLEGLGATDLTVRPLAIGNSLIGYVLEGRNR